MKQTRLKQVIANMEKMGMKQLIISDPDSIFYLTGIGYDPGERLVALYINDQGDAHLFNNYMFPQQPQKGLKIHFYDDTDDYMGMMADVVAGGDLGVDKFWRAKFMLPLLEKRPDLKLRLGSDAVDMARNFKDAEEIELMRKASALNDATMAEAIQHLGDGLTERQMVGLIGEIHLRLGADIAYDHLICFGEGCCESHHCSGSAKIQPGETAIFDIFAPVNHYWCDMTRTVFYKSASDEQRKVYDIVRAANAAGIAAIKPGIPISEVDAATRKVITDAGYGENFTHRTGHGIGLACHEPPDCSSTSQALIQPGMCFSVEPGVYLPGKWGVRIEDLVVVTEDGVEVLNKFTKDLLIID